MIDTDGSTVQELASSLFITRSKIEELKRDAAVLEERLIAEMPDKKLELFPIGVFERKEKKDRKQWRHAEVQSALIAKIRSGEARQVDDETGEIVEEDDVALTARVFTATANPSWRVTALKEMDIDPDEFCSVTSAGFSIVIHDAIEGED